MTAYNLAGLIVCVLAALSLVAALAAAIRMESRPFPTYTCDDCGSLLGTGAHTRHCANSQDS